MAVVNYQVRINGGSPIDVGNVLEYTAGSLAGDTNYDFEVRAEDASGNFSAWCSVQTFRTLAPLFSVLSTTNAVALSLANENPLYSGPCVRVALHTDSTTQTDIGFGTDGYVDMVAYAAFDPAAIVIKRYDQSGNNHHATIPFANGVILKVSTHTKKPCLYGGVVNLGSISGLTILNGVADYNIIQVEKMITTAAGVAWSCGADERSAYLGAGSEQLSDNGSSARTLFVDEYCLGKAAKLWRWQFDGGGATNALKGRIYVDEREMTSSGGSGLGSTSHTESVAGIFFNSNAAGAATRDIEVFATYIMPYDVSPSEWTFIIDATRATWFNDINPRLLVFGTSLSVGYPYNGTTNAPLEKLAANLTTLTGRTWSVLNLAEVATDLLRHLSVQQNEGRYDLDHWRQWDIRIGDGGTNDISSSSVSAADALVRATNLSNEFVAQGIGARQPVVWRNIIPRADDGIGGHSVGMTVTAATFLTKAATFNSGLAGAIDGAIHIVDAASDTRLQNPDDPTIFPDNVHCSVLGYSYMESDFEAVVRAIIGV